MKKNSTLLISLLAFIVSIPLFTGCDDPSSSSPIDTELEGTWIGTEVNGGPDEWSFIFTGKTAQCSCSTVEWYKGTIATNTSVTPKHLNIQITQCSVSQFVGLVTLAIYKISGDTLTFAGNAPGVQERPDSFDPVGDTRVFVAIKK